MATYAVVVVRSLNILNKWKGVVSIMENKSSEVINNLCTILGGALLLYPLIDEATKTIVPEMEKLKSGETLQEMKMLPPKEEKDNEREKERENHKNEIAELKRKIEELESKPSEEQN